MDSVNGNAYKTVIIGEKEWMAQNLNCSKFQNGDAIPEAKTNEEWQEAGKKGQPVWCYYNNAARMEQSMANCIITML